MVSRFLSIGILLLLTECYCIKNQARKLNFNPFKVFGLDDSVTEIRSHLGKSTIDNALKEDILYYGSVSGAAYCVPSSIESLTCGKHCSKIADLVEVTTFEGGTETPGFVAIFERKMEIIISFRGTQTPMNMFMDTRILLVPPLSDWNATDVLVHQGFLNSYNGLRPELLGIIQKYIFKYPSYKLHLTGHSLGGALATLAAVDLANLLPHKRAEILLTTFGSPRVGNENFADYFQAKIITNSGFRRRVVNARDPISHLPSMVQGYYHIAQELFTIPGSKGVTVLCESNEGEDSECSNSFIANKPFDHIYFPWGLDFGPFVCTPSP